MLLALVVEAHIVAIGKVDRYNESFKFLPDHDSCSCYVVSPGGSGDHSRIK